MMQFIPCNNAKDVCEAVDNLKKSYGNVNIWITSTSVRFYVFYDFNKEKEKRE